MVLSTAISLQHPCVVTLTYINPDLESGICGSDFLHFPHSLDMETICKTYIYGLVFRVGVADDLLGYFKSAYHISTAPPTLLNGTVLVKKLEQRKALDALLESGQTCKIGPLVSARRKPNGRVCER